MSSSSRPRFASELLTAPSSKRVNTSGSTCSEDGARRLGDVDAPAAGAAVVALEVGGAAQDRLAEQALQVRTVALLAPSLLADQRGLVRRLRLARLAGQHLPRSVELDGGAVDRVVERHDPEDRAFLLLAARPHLLDGAENSLALGGEREVERQVALLLLPAVDHQAGLELLDVVEGVRRLRLPELTDDLAVEPLRVGRLRARAVSLALPVVLGRGGDAVAVVAVADELGVLERTRSAALTGSSCESASTLGCSAAAMFSAVRWMLLTNWSRQMALATGCASGSVDLVRDLR